MRSARVTPNTVGTPADYNALLNDSAGASRLLVHQMYGTIALPTNPSNTQTLTLDINGTNVVVTFVSSIGSTAGNVLIGATAAVTVANLMQLLLNPTITNSTQVALGVNTSTPVTLVNYINWSATGTSVIASSYNATLYAPATSFSASTTATGGSYTANTMALYVEPGVVYVGGTRVIFGGGTTATVTAPSANPRIDVLAVDNTGTLSWTTGTENASPVAPTYPANKVALCELYNVVGETALYDNANQTSGQGYISNDVRPMLGLQFNPGAIPDTMLPATDGTYDLGSASFGWNNLYVKTGIFINGSPLTSTNNSIVGIAAEAVADRAALAAALYSADGGVLLDTELLTRTGGTSGSFSLTVGNNPNRTLVAIILSQSVSTIAAPTYNSVAMTQIANGGASINGISSFFLTAPATGSNTFAWSQSAAGDFQIMLFSYYNVKQTSPIDCHHESPNTGGSGNAAATTVNPGALVCGFAFDNGGTGLTPGGSVYTNNKATSSGSGRSWGYGDSGQVPYASTETLSFTGGSSSTGVGIVGLIPATAPSLAFQNASSASANQRETAFVGFAVGAQSTPGGALTCAMNGILGGFSGLKEGLQYYLNDTNGTIGTSAGSQTRKVGIAATATQLVITNNW